MTIIKRAWALALSVLMIASLIIASGVTTASALAGAGLQQTSFRSYGADISFWNVYTASGNDYSLVDFAKMKADGCDYVILRIGYEARATRQNVIDTAFVEYYKRARAAGMPLGLYFYQLCDTYEEAVDDAKWVIKVIEDNNMYFEYPLYYDVEEITYGDKPVNLQGSAMENLCLGWCETLAAAGYFPGIYGGGWSVLDKLSADFKSKYDLWYAAYPSAQNPHLTTDKSGYCGMWQFAASGYNYDGVPANASLDVNVCYKDYPAIMKQYGYNNCGESAEKTALRSSIEAAEALRHYAYNESAVSAIRTAYNNANSVLANSAATNSDFTNAKNTLDNAIKNASGVVSTGKSYTVSSNPRTDKWADDGKRLTDGTKGSIPCDTEAYVGLGNQNIDIVVDLGTGNVLHDSYGVYAGVNTGWGIAAPKKVTVYVSNDNVNYSEVATSETVYATAQNGAWTTYFINAHTKEYSFAERYVKFSIEANGGHIWLDEVTVSKATDTIRNGVYVNGINEIIGAGDCHVFTPAFGEISSSSANITWTKNVVVKWDSATSTYVVKEILGSAGSADLSVTLQSGELLIAAHSWEGEGVEDAVSGSAANFEFLATLAVGDSVSISGIDVSKATIAPASYVSLPQKSVVVPEPTPDRTENLATGKTYTTSELYGGPDAVLYPDEGGVTLTDGVVAALECPYYDPAFVGFNANSEDYQTNGYSSITVDLGNNYWINKFSINVATSFNATAGIYAPGKISVYVSDDGNEWTSAGSAVPVDDSSVGIIDTAIALDNSVYARYVQFRVVAAEGKSWMFVSEVEVFEGEAGTEPDPVYLLGDVNDDGKIDSVDYLIVKRTCFNSYELSADEAKRADVDSSTKVDSADYVIVKRIAFGTY